MTIYEVAKRTQEHGAQKFRHREGIQYDCQDDMWAGHNRKWTLMDSFTGSAIVQIYEALKPDNQLKYISLPVPRLIDVTWKLASK